LQRSPETEKTEGKQEAPKYDVPFAEEEDTFKRTATSTKMVLTSSLSCSQKRKPRIQIILLFSTTEVKQPPIFELSSHRGDSL
jgi:hypothetical protein